MTLFQLFRRIVRLERRGGEPAAVLRATYRNQPHGCGPRILHQAPPRRLWTPRFFRSATAALFLLVVPTVVQAQAPPSAEPPAQLSASAWTRMAVGRADTSLRYGGRLGVESPVFIGKTHVDLALAVELESLPGQQESFAFTDVNTWSNYFQLSGSIGRHIGSNSSLILQGRFATAFRDPQDLQARKRFLRSYGAGIEIAGLSGHWITIVYGRDEAVGAWGWGQLQLEGEFRLAGPLHFYGRAGLGFGPASLGGAQADFITCGLGVDLPALVAAIR